MTSKGIRKMWFDFGEYVVEEYDAANQWPNGDPVPRDKETLVVFLHRKNYDLSEHSFPCDSTYNTIGLKALG